MKLIKNGHIVSKGLDIPKGYVIYDKNILEIGSGVVPDNSYESVINAKGEYILPGLIDIHMHGAIGFDSMNTSQEKLLKLREYLASVGVTSFLLSTISDTNQRRRATLEEIKKNINIKAGADLIGVYLEGPFLNKEKAGAHDKDLIREFEEDLFIDFYDIIKIVTFAPECINTDIYKLKDYNIKLSVGHTMADYKTGLNALKHCDLVTHIFNAMPSIHHREPSITTAALLSDCYIEVIADNVHLHPAMYQLIYKLKKNDIILVTDSIAATGLCDGEYSLGSQKIMIKENIAKISGSDTLAGSTLELLTALKNFVNYSQASIQKAVEYVTSNPADLLKLNDRGCIQKGKRADLIITDLDRVKYTIINGETKQCV